MEEARKDGLALAELDEYGKEINPHIPQYMSLAPWYVNEGKLFFIPSEEFFQFQFIMRILLHIGVLILL